jgi:hypothetical protein
VRKLEAGRATSVSGADTAEAPGAVLRIILAAYVALALSMLFVEAKAQGTSNCAPYATPVKLNFTTDNAKTVYSNALNVTGIAGIMRRHGMAVAGAHERTLGLTSYELGLALSGDAYAVPTRSGYCVYIRSIEANFGYRSMDVHVASEYPPQTCEYKVILDHENQHVAINRNAMKEYAPRVRQALERELAKLKPRFTADAQVSTNRKLEELHEALEPLLQEMETVLAQRNAGIDTNVNYDALGEMCKNWDRGNVWPVVNPPAKQKN